MTPFDTTKFVRAAISEVYMTLIEAGGFGSDRHSRFPARLAGDAGPGDDRSGDIIGAFAAMAALGFSVNLATLFAIVLAIGIVVDDAIVIVEGVSRYVEQGIPGREAAGRAMDDLMGPVIGITLVLMSVFIPAAFLPGLTGQLYRQFALVIAATAFISAINAVTLKPTQSALWLRPPVPLERRNLFYRGFNTAFGADERGYVGLVGAMTRRSSATVVLALVLVVVAVWGLTRVPTAFLPDEDQGYLIVSAQLPDGASKERTDAVMQQISGTAKKVPGVDTWSQSAAFLYSTTWQASPTRALPSWSSMTGMCASSRRDRICASIYPESESLSADRDAGRRVRVCSRPRSRASAMSAASRCRSRSGTAISIMRCCRV